MKLHNSFKLFFLFFLFLSTSSESNEIWVLDKSLSSIKFELPILLADNVSGEFKEIEGLIEIDASSKKNNKAIFAVTIESIDLNYNKYKELLFSNIFFDSKNFPKALIDTKKFAYSNEKKLNLNVELNIKGKSNSIPLELNIIKLTEKLLQIKGKLRFSRTFFHIGTGKWRNTVVLKEMVIIDVNLFLYKEKI
jgi:polyisoprenoid-binding protein YceI